MFWFPPCCCTLPFCLFTLCQSCGRIVLEDSTPKNMQAHQWPWGKHHSSWLATGRIVLGRAGMCPSLSICLSQYGQFLLISAACCVLPNVHMQKFYLPSIDKERDLLKRLNSLSNENSVLTPRLCCQCSYFWVDQVLLVQSYMTAKYYFESPL